MKKTFLRLFITEVLLLIVAVLLLGVNILSYHGRRVDIVAINDYVQTAKEHWEAGDFAGTSLAKRKIMLLGEDGSVRYQTEAEGFEEIRSQSDALRKGMLCISVTDGEHFLGSIVMPNPAKEEYENFRGRMLGTVILIVVLIAISQVSFLWYVNHNVVRPFERMKEFAARVAQGNLDEPLLMEKNNMFGLFTESFDMMREQLRASQKREIALKMKEKELVASLSHDLRSPVTGIKVICELLEVKVEDAYVLGKIRNILHKTEEMNVLLSDLLSTALDDLGELNVNCSEMTSDVLGRLLEEHDTKKKVVAEKVPGCILRIDQNRLSQVIGNVIGNSYKYADTEIDVSYAFQDHYLMMKIRDHGEGADPEELPLLTNKFYRGKKRAADKEGSGLGLYISRELMEKMQGELLLSNEDGFIVTLLLPLA